MITIVSPCSSAPIHVAMLGAVGNWEGHPCV